MTVDQEPDSATTSTTDASTDSADTASHVDPQDSSTQDAEDSSQAAPETDQQPNDGGSSTSSDTTLQTADRQEGAPQSQVDWQAEKAKYEKRVADLRAAQGRTANELHQYKTRYKDIDPDAARKALEANKKNELPFYHPRSAENKNWQRTKDRYDSYKEAMHEAKTDAEREFVNRTIGAKFTPQQVQQIQDWELHLKQDAARRASDPEYEREQQREIMREELRQELQAQRDEADVAAWFSNPANQPIVDRYREEMIQLMNEGWHWNQVQRHIEVKAKADGLQSRVGSADKTAAAARAQQQALKSNAKASRDPAQAPVGKLDFAKIGADYAKKQGLPLNHERVLAHVEKAVANWRASQPNAE